MKLRTTLIGSFLIIGILVAIVGGVSLYQFTLLTKPLVEEIPAQINELKKHSDLDAHAQLIRYYDEVLTQSARNYAFTLDKKLEQRYNETVPLLDDAINHSIEHGDELEQQFFQNVNSSNLALIDLETRAITLANNGDAEQSISILQSGQYWNLKAIYEDGLRDYVASRGLEYDDALLQSSQVLEQTTKNTQETLSFGIEFVLIFAISASLILGFIISKSITKPLENLNDAANLMTKGKLDVKIKPVSSQNEILRLIQSFNIMSEVIKGKKLVEIEMEQIKKVNKIKDEFVAMVSHELRTPLLPIRGVCEILEDRDFPEPLGVEQKSLIESVSSNSKRLEILISRLLLVQKLEMEKYGYDMRNINVSNFLNDIHKSFSPILTKKQIKFTNSTQDNLFAFGDENSLHEIFSNLIQNAIDFCSKENPIVEIGAKEQDGMVVFFVKDNGAGIPKEKQIHLFEKFYQINTSHTRTQGGLGLGLSICKKMIDAMNGKIWVESKGKEMGTEFYFTLRKGET